MNIERVNHLVNILKNVNPKQFDLIEWVNGKLVDNLMEHSCGTTACAIGWACLDHEFNSQGLSLEKTLIADQRFVYVPIFGKLSGFYAVECFFEIDFPIAKWLFTEECYTGYEKATADDVIFRLNTMLSNPDATLDKLKSLCSVKETNAYFDDIDDA